MIATDKETGKIVWDKNLRDSRRWLITLRRSRSRISIIIGASGGDRGVRNWIGVARRQDRQYDLEDLFDSRRPASPAARPGRTRTTPGRPAAAPSTSPAPTIPPANLTYWGSGNPVPGYDAPLRPGDNLYTSSAIAFDAATGKISWWHQYTPNDNRDYDETGTHILIDTKVNGEDRKIVSHAGRNGFNYMFDRGNGQFLKAGAIRQGRSPGPRASIPKTGKPIDYDPAKDVQVYAEGPDVNDDKRDAPRMPRHRGRQQLLAGVLQPEDQAHLHSRATKAAPTSRPTTPRT